MSTLSHTPPSPARPVRGRRQSPPPSLAPARLSRRWPRRLLPLATLLKDARPWERLRRYLRVTPESQELELFEPQALVLRPQLRPLQEALRRLYIDLMPPGREPHPAIWAITSATPGEGKTTVASILAYTLSEDLDQPVLLVEGDLRRPMVARLFRVPEGPGLSDFFAGDCTVFQALHETERPGLWLLPGGTPAENPYRLLRTGLIDSFLEAARKEFGAVLLDVPALSTASEAPLLASWAEQAVLVVGSGKATIPAIRQALETLGHSQVAGIILNGVQQALPSWLEGLLSNDGNG